MKRFYATVGIGLANIGLYSILLDGKPLKTPRRADFAVPSRGLAEAIAEEWRAQGPQFDPAAMFLTRCANTAIDYTAGNEAAVIGGILAYADDLVCYRADTAAELAARQREMWDPLLEWLDSRFGVRLKTGTGVAPVRQDAAVLAKLRAALAGRGPFVLTALHAAATICGSLALALALAEGRLTAEEAFAASHLDEEYQMEKWGRTAWAEARARRLAAELSAAAQVMTLARPTA